MYAKETGGLFPCLYTLCQSIGKVYAAAYISLPCTLAQGNGYLLAVYGAVVVRILRTGAKVCKAGGKAEFYIVAFLYLSVFHGTAAAKGQIKTTVYGEVCIDL